MQQDTIDRHTADWERISGAIVFQTPDEDEIFIVDRTLCPDCGHELVLELATGALVDYRKRHVGCSIVKVVRSGEQ